MFLSHLLQNQRQAGQAGLRAHHISLIVTETSTGQVCLLIRWGQQASLQINCQRVALFLPSQPEDFITIRRSHLSSYINLFGLAHLPAFVAESGPPA
jgi:hypothetical protein